MSPSDQPQGASIARECAARSLSDGSPCAAPRRVRRLPRRTLGGCAALVLLAALSLPAFAQQSGSSGDVALRETVVTSAGEEESATGPVDGYTAKRSATATKTDTPLIEIPQSVTVISAQQIRDQNAQNLQEVLRYAPGVRAEKYGVDNRGDWFDLRGGSEGSVMIDGLRRPLSGYWGYLRDEPYAFERIEVLRGPASLLYGQSGPGGVVSLVSKLPQATAQGEVVLQLGTFEHKQVAADSTGPLNDDGTLLYRLVALVKDSGTQVDHAYEERLLLFPSLTWRPSVSTSFTVYLQYQKDESDNTNAFLPWQGTLLPAPNGPIPDSLYIAEPAWDTYGGTRKRLGYFVEHDLSEAWKLSHRLRVDQVDGHMLSMYGDFFTNFARLNPDGRTINRWWYAQKGDARIVNADLTAQGKLTFGTTQHTVLLGIDTMRFRQDDRYDGDYAATPLDVYNPVYGTFPEPTPNFSTPKVTTTVQSGVVVQDQIKFNERWVLVAGLRYDATSNNVPVEPANPTGRTENSELSRNLGAIYLANGGWAPYLSYSESFQANLGLDARGNAFEPRRGEQVEAGVKWAPPSERFVATAAIYTLKEANRLTTDPGNTNFQVPLGEVTVDGFELEGNANLPAWDLLANYAYTDARVTASANPADRALNKQLASIPEHAASTWAVHKFGAQSAEGFRAGAGIRYVGPTWDGADTIRTPSNTLLDAMASFEKGNWRYALNATNVTDESYVVTCLTRGDCWFGNRRKVVGSVAYQW